MTWWNVNPGARRRARSTRRGTTESSRTSPYSPLGLLPAGQLDHVADQRGQLVELLDHVRSQRGAVLGREEVLVAHQLEVGPDGGDRRAQLVRGIGDEVALGLHRTLERVERSG